MRALFTAALSLIVLPVCALVGEYWYDEVRWRMLERRAHGDRRVVYLKDSLVP